MNRRLFAIFTVIMSLLVACSPKNDVFRQLVAVDSLLLGHNQEDSALSILKNIRPQTREDSAYYFILETAADYNEYKEISSFDKINFSIKCYTENSDVRKLAYAYYYKSLIYYLNNRLYDDMFVSLKESERLAESTTDYRLLNRIYSAMTVASGNSRQTEVALQCAHKEFRYAKLLNDNYCMAYSLLNLATAYADLNKNDSADYYILQSLSLIKYVEDGVKTNFYNYLGEVFIKSNPLAAEKYFIDALRYGKLSAAYFNLTKLYYGQNKYDKADIYQDSALMYAWPELKYDIFSYMAENSYESQNLEKYKVATDSIIKTQKEIFDMREKNKILELQRKFDYEKQQAAYDRKSLILCLIISVLLAINVLIFLIHKQHVHKIREKEFEMESHDMEVFNKMMTMTLNVEKYKAQIAELQAENKKLASQKTNRSQTIADNDSKIVVLQEKMDLLDKQKFEYLENGKQVYQQIIQNQPITLVDDKWADCVYYFAMQEGENIFDGYNRLTINDKIFIIADAFLKKSDDEIANILAISPVTVRSRRSKIRKKKANDEA
ncbi:MAG: hypothetical protein J6W13_12770 [Salinivirgaceae bacterium]|nr:hypothetical protein [Salinivirgaceae bacterium]